MYLGSSSVVIEHNFMMTSESMNNAALIFFIANTFIYFKKPSNYRIILLLISLVFLGGTKSASAIAIILTAILFLFLAYPKIQLIKFKSIWPLLAAAPIFVLFVATALSSDITKTLTTSATINNRLWHNPEWREQVKESNYPMELREVWENHKTKNLGLPPDGAVASTKEFSVWWNEENGNNFLNIFTLKNPDYALLAPICLRCFDKSFNYSQTLIAGWAKGTNAIREYPELSGIEINRTLFWPMKPKEAYLLLGIGTVLISIQLLYIFLWSREEDIKIRNSLLLVTSYIFAFSYFSWWFGSKPDDVTRHLLAGALALRVMFVIVIINLLRLITSSYKKKSSLSSYSTKRII
jgi:hypothetical protein